jgi:hypothetical protein
MMQVAPGLLPPFGRQLRDLFVIGMGAGSVRDRAGKRSALKCHVFRPSGTRRSTLRWRFITLS